MFELPPPPVSSALVRTVTGAQQFQPGPSSSTTATPRTQNTAQQPVAPVKPTYDARAFHNAQNGSRKLFKMNQRRQGNRKTLGRFGR